MWSFQIRVAPPPGFRDDLALIGSKFDPVDTMEKEHNPEIVELKTSNNPPTQGLNLHNLQSSFGNLRASMMK